MKRINCFILFFYYFLSITLEQLIGAGSNDNFTPNSQANFNFIILANLELIPKGRLLNKHSSRTWWRIEFDQHRNLIFILE